MDTLQVLLAGLWLAWVVILLAYRAAVRRLGDLLSTSSPAEAALIQFPEGTSSFLEPFRWYLRVRCVVHQEAQCGRERDEQKITARRARRLLFLVEVGFAVLLFMIAAVSIRNF